jgi:hypothetical protein
LQITLLEGEPEALGAFSDFALSDEGGSLIGDRQVESHYRLFGRYELTIRSIYADAKRRELRSRDGSQAQSETVGGYVGDVFSALFLGNFWNTSSVVLRREILEAAGGFVTERRTQEDYELWLKVASRGPIGFVDHSLVVTRRRPGQLTSRSQNLAILENVLDVLDEVSELAETRVGHRVVRERKADVRKTLALGYLGAGNPQAARSSLWGALRLHHSSVSVMGLLLWSLLPPSVGQGVKSFARNLPGLRR